MPGTYKAPAPNKPDMVAQALGSWRQEDQEFRNQSWLHRQFEVSLGYSRPFQNEEQKSSRRREGCVVTVMSAAPSSVQSTNKETRSLDRFSHPGSHLGFLFAVGSHRQTPRVTDRKHSFASSASLDLCSKGSLTPLTFHTQETVGFHFINSYALSLV